MRFLTSFAFLLFAFTLAAPATAQDDIDCIKVDPAHHKVVFENDQVRVIRWTIPVGDKTLKHSHYNNLNIDLTDYNGKVTIEGKSNAVHVKAGSATWREAGVHVVENIGKEPMEGIIIEPKKPASIRPAGSADPVVVDAKHQKTEFENAQIRVIRERQTGVIPKHGHPDSLQILLTDMNVTLATAGGNPEQVAGKAGEVRWRSATEHAGQIVGNKPMKQIVVEMKRAPETAASVR